MIADKVLGAYAAIGTLPPAEQAAWYRRIAIEWNINTFEIPMLAGTPLPSEVVEVFTQIRASLVVTLVAQWATSGQTDPAYGLSSTVSSSRNTALVHSYSVIEQCQSLSHRGINIANVVVHTGQRSGPVVGHTIALHRSLLALAAVTADILPDTVLAVEVVDNLAADHPIPFPQAKKASLDLPVLIEILTNVNLKAAHPVGLVVNWGRLLINGDVPLARLREIFSSEVPLAGTILSGAGASPEGFRDSHNSHLDPQSGFSEQDALACVGAQKNYDGETFIGMKCSRACAQAEEVGVEEVLQAQADLLGRIA